MIPGWPYSFVTALLDATRILPDDDVTAVTAVTAAQLREGG